MIRKASLVLALFSCFALVSSPAAPQAKADDFVKGVVGAAVIMNGIGSMIQAATPNVNVYHQPYAPYGGYPQGAYAPYPHQPAYYAPPQPVHYIQHQPVQYVQPQPIQYIPQPPVQYMQPPQYAPQHGGYSNTLPVSYHGGYTYVR
jgi:hypothetical protein